MGTYEIVWSCSEDRRFKENKNNKQKVDRTGGVDKDQHKINHSDTKTDINIIQNQWNRCVRSIFIICSKMSEKEFLFKYIKHIEKIVKQKYIACLELQRGQVI